MRQGGLSLWGGMLVCLLSGCMIGASGTRSLPTVQPATEIPLTASPRLYDSFRLPPVTPITQPEPPFCSKAPRSRLIVNERGRVTNNGQTLNVRTLPGTDARLIGKMPPGAVFLVLGGPRCVGEFAWFYILYQGMEGWIAEADDDVLYAEPYLEG